MSDRQPPEEIKPETPPAQLPGRVGKRRPPTPIWHEPRTDWTPNQPLTPATNPTTDDPASGS